MSLKTDHFVPYNQRPNFLSVCYDTIFQLISPQLFVCTPCLKTKTQQKSKKKMQKKYKKTQTFPCRRIKQILSAYRRKFQLENCYYENQRSNFLLSCCDTSKVTMVYSCNSYRLVREIKTLPCKEKTVRCERCIMETPKKNLVLPNIIKDIIYNLNNVVFIDIFIIFCFIFVFVS